MGDFVKSRKIARPFYPIPRSKNAPTVATLFHSIPQIAIMPMELSIAIIIDKTPKFAIHTLLSVILYRQRNKFATIIIIMIAEIYKIWSPSRLFINSSFNEWAHKTIHKVYCNYREGKKTTENKLKFLHDYLLFCQTPWGPKRQST